MCVFPPFYTPRASINMSMLSKACVFVFYMNVFLSPRFTPRDLSGNNLAGSIPPDIKALTQLQDL